MNNLLSKVSKLNTLKKAWKSIKHRENSKGLDEQSITDFRINLDENLENIRKELLSNTYKFSLLRGYPLLKDGKKPRPLKIPAVRDRVVQKAIQLIIVTKLNARYKIDNSVSYAYIKNRSVMKAIQKVRDLYLDGYTWVYRGDIEKFFDTVDPKKLLQDYIFPVLTDDSINDLITNALQTEVGNKEELDKLGYSSLFLSDEVGIAQGGLLSPLFANVYLHEFDKEIIKKKIEMVRYADDFIILCKTKEEAFLSYQLSKDILESKLQLKLHDLGSKKSSIEKFNNLTFLGIRFRGEKIYPGSDAFKNMTAILKSFRKKPKKTNLVENLNFLKVRVQTWSSTYLYTEIEDALYRPLEDNLRQSISYLMQYYGFRAIEGSISDKTLRKIGIPMFMETLKMIKKRKSKDVEKFYKITK